MDSASADAAPLMLHRGCCTVVMIPNCFIHYGVYLCFSTHITTISPSRNSPSPYTTTVHSCLQAAQIRHLVHL